MSKSNKKKGKILAGVVIVIGVMYFGVSWYFSSVLVDFEPRPLEEDRTNLKIESPAQFGLQAMVTHPEHVAVPPFDPYNTRRDAR